MTQKKEWIGKRFGKLLVIAEAEPHITPSGNKTCRFVCKCDCGNTVTVLRNELANGRVSCGCSRWEKARIDLTGKRFGRLVVEKRVRLDEPKSNGVTTGWLCKCNCGNEVVYLTKDLRNAGTISCGCALRDTAKAKIEGNVNERYGGTMISMIRPKRGANKNSKTGVKGVHWSSRENRFIAKIGIKGKTITLGRFATLEAARQARLKAEEEYYEPIIKEYEMEKKK